MPKILPLRDYDEHDVINVFTFSGTHPANAGTVVTIGGSGYTTDNLTANLLGNVGQGYANVVSERFGVYPYVQQAASGDNVLGILLYDVRETDENGEKLIFHPQKAKENNWTISGQAVPVLTRGFVMYSGIIESVTAGVPLYVSGGSLTPTAGDGGPAKKVAKALGRKDAHGWCYIQINPDL